MPLLKRQVEISPRNLFDLTEADCPWWVAHTRSRQEKALARFLLPRGLPFYLPQFERRSRRAGRERVSHLPLFPGYVFFRGPAAVRRAVLDSHLLVAVLPVDDQGALQHELSTLRALQESGASLVPIPNLQPGDLVRVTDGPFRGYSGVVTRGQSRLRLVVSVSMLRKTVAVEFDRHLLAQEAPVHRSGRIAAA